MIDKKEEEDFPPYSLTVIIVNKNSMISKKININKEIIKILKERVSKLSNIDIKDNTTRKKKVPGKLIHTIKTERTIKKIKQIIRKDDKIVSK
tara:strand:+ start:521 stop:799 length:279 start_codon:yes stop_codon:yes gene_type:complete